MIRLNLKEHCIERAAKKALQDLISNYLKNGDEETGKKIEFLREFLMTQDFRKIRAESPELSGGKDVDVLIIREGKEFKIKLIKE
jgi:hypothetical protein